MSSQHLKTAIPRHPNTNKQRKNSPSSHETLSSDPLSSSRTMKARQNSKKSRPVKDSSYHDSTNNSKRIINNDKRRDVRPRNARCRSVDNSRLLKEQEHHKSALIDASSPKKIKLKTKVNKLERVVKDQAKTLEEVYSQVTKERNEVKSLARKFLETKKKGDTVGELQWRLDSMQDQELRLLTELQDQRKVTDSLLDKLNVVQAEAAIEIENAKKHYKNYYAKSTEKEIARYKHRIDSLSNEKDQLLSNVKGADKVKNIEVSRCRDLEKELAEARSELEKERKKNDSLKEEVDEVDEYVREKDGTHKKEVEALKACIEQLREENEALKTKGEEWRKADMQEKTQLSKRVKDLEEDVARKDKVIFETERGYRSNLEQAEKRLVGLEEENNKLGIYQKRLEDLKRDVIIRDEEHEMKERYYKEKLENLKRAQDQRKREWASVYNELLEEVRDLKQGMSFYDVTASQQLLSSINSKSFEHYI